MSPSAPLAVPSPPATTGAPARRITRLETATAPVLGLDRVTKRFGAFTALDEVSLDVHDGEIHCLLGENGAGKSTLCNLVFGVHRPDGGALHLHGQPFQPLGPAHALASGIAMVHQHFSLVGTMSAIENMMLGRARGRLRPREMRTRVQALAGEFRLDVDLDRPVEELSVGERQRVEVLKCLLDSPRLLVLDEPTAILPPREVGGLLAMCRQVAERGCGVVLVTHKLAELAEIATRTTVLRRGRVIETVVMSGAPGELAGLVRSMVGREVRPLDSGKTIEPEDPARAPAAEALRVEGLVVKDDAGVTRLDVSFAVRRGEIVGLAGVEGNGQSQLGLVLAGLLAPSRGRVLLDGQDVSGLSPRALTRRGMGVVPEDRHAVGCHLGLNVAENLFLGNLQRFTRFGLVRRDRLAEEGEARMKAFDVRAASSAAPMSSLSGGNQQKVVLARELSLDPLRFLLAAQPTRGLDVGAVEAVYSDIRTARVSGAGVLLVSSELDELIAVADRILVIYKGRIVGTLPAVRECREAIGALMSGQTGEEERRS
jgi:simple sugar transport system ATP-binding protein